MTAYPLPSLGLCPVCEGDVKVRKSGVLFKHDVPRGSDAPIRVDARGFLIATCLGSGRTPAGVLEPTFARWLHSHASRTVDRDDPVSRLANWVFIGCSARRTPADVPWTTPDELHAHQHERDRMRQQADEPRACGWLCDDIAAAARIYAGLLAAREATA